MSIPHPQVAIVLAAGASTRFADGFKQLAVLGDQALVERAAQAALAAGCFEAVLVVSGAVSLSGVVPAGATIVDNPRWASGQASSLQAGIEAARALGAEAVVVGLADQPMVTAEDWLLVSAAETELPIVVATYQGIRGNPVRLAASIWDDLPEDGDEGARVLLRKRPDLVAAVACLGDASDVDTVEDLKQWN
ncbi:MAG: nucleotidyltransferase family protein [Acidimicrobiales bacterium]